jgi:hypothetical protein
LKRFNGKLKASITCSVCGPLDLQDTFTAPVLTDTDKHVTEDSFEFLKVISGVEE